MTTSALDILHRRRFDWPEPLVLDVIGESYVVRDDGDRWAAAYLHARFLHRLVDDETMGKPTARLELIAYCAARGISADRIEATEQAVFDELIRLVEMRFRNSPRARAHFLGQLQAARQKIARRAEPRRAAAPRHGRVPLRLRPSLIPTAA